jgi:hypothetical protein
MTRKVLEPAPPFFGGAFSCGTAAGLLCLRRFSSCGGRAGYCGRMARRATRKKSKALNAIDKHVGNRVRMCRLMLRMNQQKLR